MAVLRNSRSIPAPARALASALPLLLAAGVSACYTTRSMPPEALRGLEEPAICRLYFHEGDVLRASVDPVFVTAEELRCYPCVHEASSWEVRYSGWPAVFSSGKEWRRALRSEELVVVPLEEIDRVEVESFSWFWTLTTSPVTVPAGIVDFLVRYARIGFDAVNDRIGTFSSTPD